MERERKRERERGSEGGRASAPIRTETLGEDGPNSVAKRREGKGKKGRKGREEGKGGGPGRARMRADRRSTVASSSSLIHACTAKESELVSSRVTPASRRQADRRSTRSPFRCF